MYFSSVFNPSNVISPSFWTFNIWMIPMPEYTYQNCVGEQKVKRQKKNNNYPPPQCLFEASYSVMERQNRHGERKCVCVKEKEVRLVKKFKGIRGATLCVCSLIQVLHSVLDLIKSSVRQRQAKQEETGRGGKGEKEKMREP